MGLTIGIDLGTTYSAVAMVDRSGRPEIVPNAEGQRITPSVVFFSGDAALVGAVAKRSAAVAPLDTVQFVKRAMGDPAWRFETGSGQHDPAGDGVVATELRPGYLLDGAVLRPAEVTVGQLPPTTSCLRETAGVGEDNSTGGEQADVLGAVRHDTGERLRQ